MKKFLFILALIFFTQLFYSIEAFAATRTWDGGGGDNNWSTCANWDGPDICPTSSDIATFEGLSTKDATIDAGFAGSVTNLNINSGYTGTITQDRSLTVTTAYTQAAGTFAQGSNTLSVRNFTKSGGTFTEGTGTLRFYTDGTIDVATSEDFYNISFEASASNVTVASGDTIVANGTLTFNGTSMSVSTGTINPKGNVVVTNGSGGTAIVLFDQAATQSISHTGGRMPELRINNASQVVNVSTSTLSASKFTLTTGTFNAPTGVFNVSGNFTKSGGTFNEGTGTVTITSDSTVDVVTSEDFYNLSFEANASNVIVASGDTLVVNGTLTFNGTSMSVSTGTINPRGNVVVTNGSGGTAVVLFDQAATQSISHTSGRMPELRINNASQIVNVSTSTLSASKFTLTDGTFNAPTGNFSVSGNFTKSGGTFNEGTGTTSISSDCTLDVVTSEDFYNFTFDATASTLTIAAGDTIVVNGTFTANATISSIASTGTIDLYGNAVITTISTLNAPIRFLGSASTQTFSSASATVFNGDMTINKSSGEVQLLSTFTLDAANQDLVLTQGTLNLNGNSVTVNGSSGVFTVGASGTLKLRGNETITANATYPSLASGSTVLYTGDGDAGADSYTLKNYAYHHLTINSTDGATDTFSLPATLDINGNLTITAGTLDATATPYNMTVGGNWSNSGTFTPRTGTVTLDGTSQSILGSTTFRNLTKSVSSADTLTFANNGTQTITGTMTLNGQSGSLLSLVSNSPTNQWELDPQGTRTISYLSVTDSNNINVTTIPVSGLNITNGGNNTGWGFNSNPDAPSSLGGAGYVDGSTTGDTTPTLTFSLSDSDGSDTVKYKIEIDDSSNFGSLVVDYTSALAAQGAFSFTVGQAAGSGSYSTGTAGQTLSGGSYYWRVRTEDNSGATSSYSTANGGAVAFVIDTTAPTITNVSSDKADGSYTVGEVIDIDVTFSEAVTSVGVVTVTLETGATDRTCTFTVTSSTTGTCNYTAQTGDISSDLEVLSISGTINDEYGNAMSDFTPATNLAANKAVVIYYTPAPSGGGSSGSRSTRTLRALTELLSMPVDSPAPLNSRLTNPDKNKSKKEDKKPTPPVVDTPPTSPEDSTENSPSVVEDPVVPLTTPEDEVITLQVSLEESIRSVLSTGAKALRKASGLVLNVAREAGEEVMIIVPVVGMATAGGLVALETFTYPALFSVLSFKRSWLDTISIFGTRKRRRNWGTVYDSETKQPLDPVLVVLKDLSGKEIASTVTDIDGRYGFVAPPGEYVLEVRKENFSFPSKKISPTGKDIIYDNLYFGNSFTVTPDKAFVSMDIPMDQENFDQNQYYKVTKKGMYFFSKHEIFWVHITGFLFYAGLVFSLANVYINPSSLNVTIMALQFALLGLRSVAKTSKYGVVKFKADGAPLAFALVRLFHSNVNLEIRRTVTDQYGRYCCLVPPGEYHMVVERRNPDGTYTKILSTGKFTSRRGFIAKQLVV